MEDFEGLADQALGLCRGAVPKAGGGPALSQACPPRPQVHCRPATHGLSHPTPRYHECRWLRGLEM